MTEEKTEGRCVVCKEIRTKDWYAWNDLMPPPPDYFHLVGEIYVPNPGVEPLLTPKEPQGINPEILLMDLFLCQKPGIWIQVFVWKPVRYDKVIRDTIYKQVQVFCEDVVIAEIPAEVVQ